MKTASSRFHAAARLCHWGNYVRFFHAFFCTTHKTHPLIIRYTINTRSSGLYLIQSRQITPIRAGVGICPAARGQTVFAVITNLIGSPHLLDCPVHRHSAITCGIVKGKREDLMQGQR